jgi:hypothetical protein
MARQHPAMRQYPYISPERARRKRSGGFDMGAAAVNLPAIGPPLRPPVEARSSRREGSPRQIRRGSGRLVLGSAAPFSFALSRQPTGVCAAGAVSEAEAVRRVGGASGPGGAALKTYRKSAQTNRRRGKPPPWWTCITRWSGPPGMGEAVVGSAAQDRAHRRRFMCSG